MPKIVYLCSDLLFTSKIRETARALGHDAVAARDPGALAAAAADAVLAIVDLRRPDALEALDRLRATDATRELPTFGFVDHERADLFDEARRRGCTPLAKGKFSTELRHLLQAAPDGAGRDAAR